MEQQRTVFPGSSGFSQNALTLENMDGSNLNQDRECCSMLIIRSGGQSGVDRAALDTARAYGIPICGWCPNGGWAEDFPSPPGLLAWYPELVETPLSRVEQRTVWNVRDSVATLIISPQSSSFSGGTRLTERAAEVFHRPLLTVHGPADARAVALWLNSLENDLVLNIGGPRASECPSAYEETARLLSAVFRHITI